MEHAKKLQDFKPFLPPDSANYIYLERPKPIKSSGANRNIGSQPIPAKTSVLVAKHHVLEYRIHCSHPKLFSEPAHRRCRGAQSCQERDLLCFDVFVEAEHPVTSRIF